MPWELRNDRQIWQQLAETLTLRIVSGLYPSGVKLPSVRDLAAEAGVNPNTMQRALSSLEESNLLCSQRNTGRFVTQDTDLINVTRSALAQAEYAIFCQKMHRLGYHTEEIEQFFPKKGETV